MNSSSQAQKGQQTVWHPVCGRKRGWKQQLPRAPLSLKSAFPFPINRAGGPCGRGSFSPSTLGCFLLQPLTQSNPEPGQQGAPDGFGRDREGGELETQPLRCDTLFPKDKGVAVILHCFSWGASYLCFSFISVN